MHDHDQPSERPPHLGDLDQSLQQLVNRIGVLVRLTETMRNRVCGPTPSGPTVAGGSGEGPGGVINRLIRTVNDMHSQVSDLDGNLLHLCNALHITPEEIQKSIEANSPLNIPELDLAGSLRGALPRSW